MSQKHFLLLIIMLCLVAGIVLFTSNDMPAPKPPKTEKTAQNTSSTDTPPAQAVPEPEEVEDAAKEDTPATFISGTVVSGAGKAPVTDYWITAIPNEAYDFLEGRGGLQVDGNFIETNGPTCMWNGLSYTWIHIQDPQGQFRLTEFDTDNPLCLRVNGDSYIPEGVFIGRIALGESVEDMVVKLKSGACVDGLVTDLDGVPIEDAHITVVSGESRRNLDKTDVTGKFAAKALSPKENTLVIGHYDFAEETVEIDSSESAVQTVHVKLRSFSAIEGFITNDGMPVAGGIVRFTADDVRVGLQTAHISAQDGYYRIERLPACTGSLCFADEEQTVYRAARNVEVGDEETVTVNFDLQSTNCAIEGMVTVDGELAEGGVTARYLDRNETKSVQALVKEGAYLLENVVPGTIELRVDVRREIDPKRWITIIRMDVQGEGTTRQDVNFNTKSVGTMYGRVEGLHDEEMMVAVGTAMGNPDSQDLWGLHHFLVSYSEVEKDGTYRLPSLLPGIHRPVVFLFPKAEYRSLSQMNLSISDPVQISAGTEIEVNLIAP